MTPALHEAASAGYGARAVEDRATRRAIADARGYHRLQPLAEPAELDFADYLHERRSDIALAPSRAGVVRLDYAVTNGILPIATAVQLGLIADELIENALQRGFPGGRGGRIAVSFAAMGETWVLLVEDSGVGRTHGTRANAGLTIAGALATLLGGELAIADVVAGTRCTVTLPRPWPSAVPRAEGSSTNRHPSGPAK
jgi:two-component sensor histidine kinase